VHSTNNTGDFSLGSAPARARSAYASSSTAPRRRQVHYPLEDLLALEILLRHYRRWLGHVNPAPPTALHVALTLEVRDHTRHRQKAFEERFILAEEKGEVLTVLSYQMASKRLLLELLVADPWAEERTLATALYAGAAALAWEAGIGEVRARPNPYGDYPGEVGYRWWRGGWRSDATFPFEVWGRLPAGGWHRVFALPGFGAVPFFRAFRDQDSYTP
jgi:hypothetical protein